MSQFCVPREVKQSARAKHFGKGSLTVAPEACHNLHQPRRQDDFADTRLSQKDLKEAKKLLEESIPEYQAVDDKKGVVLNLDSLGDIWRQNGELDKAETASESRVSFGETCN
jgi:hypothetical protein